MLDRVSWSRSDNLLDLKKSSSDPIDGVKEHRTGMRVVALGCYNSVIFHWQTWKVLAASSSLS